LSPVTFRKFSFAAGFATALLAYALPADAQGIGLLRDTETEEMLKSYEAPLARAAGLDPNSVKTYLVGDPSLNAFAMQPANIFICAGMLLWLRTPNELIGVMAHETGHISGAHLTRGSFGAKKAMIPMLASLVIGLGAMLAGAGELGMVMMGLGQAACRNPLPTRSPPSCCLPPASRRWACTTPSGVSHRPMRCARSTTGLTGLAPATL
jgi:predicted Zn-dependent protease